jgi:translation initiation factor IF-2
MGSNGKTYRITKVARELNISWKHLVDHLRDNGFEVESKITAKIDQEMYNVLAKEYQSDRKARAEAEALEINIRKEKETLTADLKSHPTGKVAKKEFEETVFIKDTGLSSKPQTTEPVKETPVTPAPPVEETPVAPETPAAPEKPEVKETPKTEKAPEAKKGPKVVGKIDLKPKKPVAPKEDKPEKPVVEESKKVSKVEEPTVETPQVKPPVTEVKVTTEETKESPQDAEAGLEIKKTKYEKLGGLKIKGKIELPKEPVKKPVKKDKPVTAGPDRTKRKRVHRPRKVDPSAPQARGNRNRKKPEEKADISEKDIQDKIKSTLAKLGQKSAKAGANRQKLRRQKRDEHKVIREEQEQKLEEESKTLQATEFVTASELATMMSVDINEIITACFSLGLMVSINQRLDKETIQIVSDEFGYEVNFVDAETQIDIEEDEEDSPEDLLERAPIVTVMGHVDHGKTSLLDYVRRANVIAGEAGGITQHVAAYEVSLENGNQITFIDTPGHEAFTAMRARGAKITDLAIIVIACDDDVMPQTKEAIAHAQAAEVPIVFALNKMDLDTANPDKVREQLSQMNILVEEWGGKFQSQEISAKKGTNINELLEKVILEAELLELKANPNKKAKGSVMEARQEKGRGTTVTLVVQEGTLRPGDVMVAGHHFCRVRAMLNERDLPVQVAGPSTPVKVLGFTTTPTAGDTFHVLESEQEAKDIAKKRAQLQREQSIRTTKRTTLVDLGNRIAVGNFQELNVIIKADVDGSSEALADSLLKLSTESTQLNVVHKAVGQITESDVLLATASNAIIIGFQVRPSATAKKLAEHEGIEIRLYSVIYKAIEDLESALEGMLAPEFEEKITGNAEIREVFKISKVGAVAGSMIVDGKVFRDNKIRLIREGVVVYEGELASLKRFKDDVKEVAKGYECGLQIKNYNDIHVGDLVECFEMVEVERKKTK